MAKSQQAAPRSNIAAAPTTGAQSATTPATDAQSLVGNQAVANNKTAAAVAPEETPLLSSMGADTASAAADGGFQGKPKRGPTGGDSTRGVGQGAGAQGAQAAPAKEADPVSRPASVKKGAKGALISAIGGGDIAIKSDATAAASTVATVANGSGCKVLETNGASIKVQVRVGKENKQGWVAASMFSDQPSLGMDDDNAKLMDDFVYADFGGDELPGVNPKAEIGTQGALGDCFLVASIAAITNAYPEFIKGLVEWNPKKKRYIVHFHQEVGKGQFVPVDIEVDGFLPTERGNKNDPAYTGDQGTPQWGAVIEKAYAKFKGGYNVLDDGGTADEAMAVMTGVKSVPKDPSAMKESAVIPFFQDCTKKGLAVCAGVINSIKQSTQTPLAGSNGSYAGRVKQPHEWNEIYAETLTINDKSGQVAEARDNGTEGDATADIVGTDVKSGEVAYKENTISVDYKKGKAPKSAGDLQVDFESHGVVDAAKMIIGNHMYVYQGVVNGNMLQFYNPWGSYQPKPVTAGEFLKYFDTLSSNAVPKKPGA
jgi:hypothetical protein